MRKTCMNRLVAVAIAFACCLAAWAMPTKEELMQAQELVKDLTADDVRALKSGAKKPGEVAAAQVALADEAETEAGKYLLLQGAFRLYSRSADYDAAADVLARMRRDISDLPPEVVVELVTGEYRRVAAGKAEKVMVIYRYARRTIKYRKDLAAAEKATTAKPGDVAALRRMAECHAVLGDWAKALETFAKLDVEAAKFELDPASAKGCDMSKAADFWWNYPTKDDEPFKVHAAVLYQKGLADGSITGLRKTLAEKRVKQMESLLPTEGDVAANVSAAPCGGTEAGQPKTKMLDLGGGVMMEMIYVTPGSFMMGRNGGNPNSSPAHKVTLTKGYWLGKYEVTQRQWKQMMGRNPSKFKGDDLPVDSISWDDCQSFITKVNARQSGELIRLPTEAEWEYACRAGTDGDFGGTGNLDEMGWYKDNSGGKTHPAGEKRANDWGFYDMHGNVREWCNDRWGAYSRNDVSDPAGSSSGDLRVSRGGHWDAPTGWCLSIQRWKEKTTFVGETYGFRLCMSADQGTPSGRAVSRGSGAPAALVKAPDANAKRPMKIQLGGGVEIEMLPCPAGTFTMGSIGSSSRQSAWRAHRVTISRSFWMSRYPLTYAQAKAITGKTCKEENQWGVPPFPWAALGGDKTPAGASPRQALELLETMNAKYASRLPKGYVFRFPTEAEWEYGFKGGKEGYWDGDACKRRIISVEERQKAMERKGLKVRDFEKFPWVLPYVPVGTKEPNEWGFYDLLGNGWTYLLDTVEGDHSDRLLDVGADEILAGLYKDGDTDPVPYYEGKGKRIVMRGSGWGDAKFKGQRYKKVLFSCADVFHHDGHIRLVIGPDLLKERGIKLPNLGK